jgi:hypothetical protein
MPSWLVQGTDIETGESQAIVIEGISKAHAEVLALKRGMRVESVEPDQLCPGDESRLSAINFVDPTEPIERGAGGGGELELAEPGFLLPTWFTCRRCKQAKTVGLLLMIAGVAAYLAHMPHEGYAFAAVLGLLLVIGSWAARRFNLIRIVPLPQQA